MKIRTEKVIDVSDWDDLVAKTYGREYSLQQQDGCMDRGRFCISVPSVSNDFHNDAVPEIVNHDERGVSFAAWSLETQIRNFRHRKPASSLEYGGRATSNPKCQWKPMIFQPRDRTKPGKKPKTLDG